MTKLEEAQELAKKNPVMKRLMKGYKSTLIPRKSYVLGFVFDAAGHQVLLLRKPCQENKLNGIGGKIDVEKGESPKAAMIRECWQEADLHIDEWTDVCSIAGKDWEMVVLCAFTNSIFDATNSEGKGETLVIQPARYISFDDTVALVPWLIPMALCARDRQMSDRDFYIEII